MPGTTSPDNLVFPIVGDSASPRAAVTQLADSVQDALDDIHASADRVVNFYGPAGSIGVVVPKQGDTYRESDGLKRLWIYDGATWVSSEVGGLYLIRPTSVSGTGTTISSDGSVAFAANGTALSVDGCFTARFRRYRIEIIIDSTSSDTDVYLRLRAAGVDVGAGLATWVRGESSVATGPVKLTGSAQSDVAIGRAGTVGAMMSFEVQNPAHAVRKFCTGTSFDSAAFHRYGGGLFNFTTVTDGFSFGSRSAITITGSLKVYGLI